MKILQIVLICLVSVLMSTPAYAANWGPLKKGVCEGTTGKRIYTAKLKRNFGDDPAVNLCPRLHKTVNGKSRVPDKCQSKGMSGYVGIWLVADKSCVKKDATQMFTPRPVSKNG